MYHINDIVYTFDRPNWFFEVMKSRKNRNKWFLDKYYNWSIYITTLTFKTRKECFKHIQDILDFEEGLKRK